jgi:hypothetical protein
MIALETKHPLESYLVSLDFNPVLFGDTLSDFTLSAKDDLGNSVSSVFDNLGQAVGIGTIRIKNGQNGRQYKFTAIATQSDGSKNETDFYLDVNNRRLPVLVEPFQTNESRTIGIYFTNLLEGKLIASVSYQAIDLATGSSAPIFTAKGFDAASNLVSVFINGLITNNKDYILYAIVTDNSATPNIYVEELYISVRDI